MIVEYKEEYSYNFIVNISNNLDRKIYKLHVADIDGFNSVAIYKSSKQLMSPTWAPKNDKIAYVSFENNRPEIFVQSLSTGERDSQKNS